MTKGKFYKHLLSPPNMARDSHLGLHESFLSGGTVLPISLEQYLKTGNAGSAAEGKGAMTGRHYKAVGTFVGQLMPTPQSALSALELESFKQDTHLDLVLDAQVHETSKKVGLIFEKEIKMYYWTGTGYSFNSEEPSPLETPEKKTSSKIIS